MKTSLMGKLCAYAKSLAGVQEDIACEGTAAESRRFKAQGKSILFVRPKNVMLRLSGSIPEATKLAAKEPELYRVGAGGWADT